MFVLDVPRALPRLLREASGDQTRWAASLACGRVLRMALWHVVVLAIVQGLAELLPVSSSAHVVVAEKLMHMDPSSPEMTLLLVMLHTGTMFAVIVYFWKQWLRTYFQTAQAFKTFAVLLIVATALTGIRRRRSHRAHRTFQASAASLMPKSSSSSATSI